MATAGGPLRLLKLWRLSLPCVGHTFNHRTSNPGYGSDILELCSHFHIESGFVTDEEVKRRESTLRNALKNDSQFQVKEGASLEVAQVNFLIALPQIRIENFLQLAKS